MIFCEKNENHNILCIKDIVIICILKMMCVKGSQQERDILEEVKRNGLALLFVKEQTPEICMRAFRQNRDALTFVRNEFMIRNMDWFF